MALSTPFGVEVECLPDVEAVRNKLYVLRADVKDDDLKKIALCQSPFDPGRLWLVRKEPSDETP
jgi:hypothetical protein